MARHKKTEYKSDDLIKELIEAVAGSYMNPELEEADKNAKK